MPEDQDKKISYKILTAEELLKEEVPPTKEIEHKEEEIEIPVAQKIEGSKETITEPSEEIKEKIEVIQPQKEAGLIYPEVEKEEEKQTERIISQPSTQKVEIPIPKPTEILPPEENLVQEEPSKEEIFYTPQKERELSFRPRPEILQEETNEEEIFKKAPEPKPRLSFNLYKFFLLGGSVVLIFLLILFLKPQEKFKSIFKSKEGKKSEEAKIITPTSTVILFPVATVPAKISTITPATSTITTSTITISTITPTTTVSMATKTMPIVVTTSTIKETTSTSILGIKISTETKPISKTTITTPTAKISITTPTESTFPKIKVQTSQGISFLTDFSSEEVNLEKLDFSSWQKKIEDFLSLQEYAGTKINVNFLYQGNNVPYDFFFDYFIKPTKISQSKISDFKNNLTGDYGFIIYYGYTRKYPILIFGVKDKDKVEKFNQNWEKLNMKEDLKTLFLGLEAPKTKNNFVTKKQEGYSYRILNFGDNFKIIWTIVDNYLIYSTTEMGIKEIFSFFR